MTRLNEVENVKMEAAVPHPKLNFDATLYDEILVPRLFQRWGRILLDRVVVHPGDSVLDVATGPGTVARMASERVGPQGRIVATDISAEMLEVARRKPPVPNGGAIEYVKSSADVLSVPAQSFDVVVCQQGVQSFPDALAAVKVMHAALKPGGRVGISVWRNLPDMPYFSALYASIGEVMTKNNSSPPPGSGQRWYLATDLEKLLSEGGFKKSRLHQERLPMTFEGGIPQVLATVAATPVWQAVSKLSGEARTSFESKLSSRMQTYARDGKIVISVASFIAVGEA